MVTRHDTVYFWRTARIMIYSDRTIRIVGRIGILHYDPGNIGTKIIPSGYREVPMPRSIRYQGAILRDEYILLIQHREHASGHSYWLLPGGGREDGETEEQCVLREMKEETGLDVKVERLLMDEPEHPGGAYQRHKTYLCTILSGEAQPGYEPEPEVAALYRIAAVSWFNLRDEASWGEKVISDPFTYPEMKRIREILGKC
jgi:8-oxo-dGTP pyrophosphatase MutT (NUDIX family)